MESINSKLILLKKATFIYTKLKNFFGISHEIRPNILYTEIINFFRMK